MPYINWITLEANINNNKVPYLSIVSDKRMLLIAIIRNHGEIQSDRVSKRSQLNVTNHNNGHYPFQTETVQACRIGFKDLNIIWKLFIYLE